MSSSINIFYRFKKLQVSTALVCSLFSFGLISCGTSSTLVPSSTANTTSSNQNTPAPSTSTVSSTSNSTTTTSTSNLAPPYTFGYKLDGSAGLATAPPTSYASPSQSYTVQTDSILKITVTANSLGSIYTGITDPTTGPDMTVNGFSADCFRFGVAIGSQSPVTVTVKTSSDGTGTCADGTVANPTVDFSSQLDRGSSAPVKITISNLMSLTCGPITYYGRQSCIFNTLLKSYVASGNLIVHVNGTQ